MYLVTGGAGFIGSNIAEKLLEMGEEVRVVDNLSTGRFSNIEPFVNDIDFILGDLCDYKVAERAVEGVDYVLHQAAVPSVPRSVNEPIRTNNSIVTATLNLFEAAKKSGVKRIVQASSSSVYGNSPTLPKVETMSANPISPYAIAKYTQETYGRIFSNLYNMSIVSLRYFNVFGPRQDPFSEYSAVIPKFISLILEGKTPTIYGDGETTRDFTYIENVVNANLLACKADDKVSGEFMNIACGDRISLVELVNIINRVTGKNIKPKFGPERPGDVKHSLADISKANKLINYEPKISVEEGIKKTIEYIIKDGA